MKLFDTLRCDLGTPAAPSEMKFLNANGDANGGVAGYKRECSQAWQPRSPFGLVEIEESQVRCNENKL